RLRSLGRSQFLGTTAPAAGRPRRAESRFRKVSGIAWQRLDRRHVPGRNLPGYAATRPRVGLEEQRPVGRAVNAHVFAATVIERDPQKSHFAAVDLLVSDDLRLPACERFSIVGDEAGQCWV